MATLVVPQVVRYSFSGTYGEATWANVMDFRVDEEALSDRAIEIENVAGVLEDAWKGFLVPLLVDDLVLTSISWVDLDSADGSTGSIGISGGAGNDTTPPTSAQVSVLIRKNTTGGRSSRPGRWYLPGIPEAGVGITGVDSGYRTALQTALNNWQAALTGPVSQGSQIEPVVVHTRNTGTEQNPNIVYVSTTPITSYTVSGTAATQRRRLRR